MVSSSQEQQQQFAGKPFHLSQSVLKGKGATAVNSNYPFILSSSGDRNSIACALSGGGIDIHDLNVPLSAKAAFSVKGPSAEDVISGLLFDSSDPSLLWSSSKTLNSVFLYDMRTSTKGQPAQSFQHSGPILSFDINSSHTLLAVGTELVKTDSPLLFFDLRNSSLPCASFEEVHSDDITQVKFHPTLPNALITGSTDGLINSYDLTTMIEDDCLYQVIKDDSISKIGFFGPSWEYIYAATHMETVSLYTFENAETICKLGDVRGANPDLSLDYVIDFTFCSNSNHLFLHAGSQTGSIGILNVTMGGLELIYTLNQGHEDIIRGIYWFPEKGMLISGCEDGRLCSWMQ